MPSVKFSKLWIWVSVTLAVVTTVGFFVLRRANNPTAPATTIPQTNIYQNRKFEYSVEIPAGWRVAKKLSALVNLGLIYGAQKTWRQAINEWIAEESEWTNLTNLSEEEELSYFNYAMNAMEALKDPEAELWYQDLWSRGQVISIRVNQVERAKILEYVSSDPVKEELISLQNGYEALSMEYTLEDKNGITIIVLPFFDPTVMLAVEVAPKSLSIEYFYAAKGQPPQLSKEAFTRFINSLELPNGAHVSIPLYPHLDWKEVPHDKQRLSNTLYVCPHGKTCTAREHFQIILPRSVNATEHIASIKHDPPVRLGKESEHFRGFLAYYDEKLRKLGFTNGRVISLPDFGVDLEFHTYELVSQTTAHYGRIKGGRLQLVTIQNNAKDTTNCPEEQKNLYGECNMTAEEIYTVHTSEPVLLSDIFKK